MRWGQVSWSQSCSPPPNLISRPSALCQRNIAPHKEFLGLLGEFWSLEISIVSIQSCKGKTVIGETHTWGILAATATVFCAIHCIVLYSWPLGNWKWSPMSLPTEIICLKINPLVGHLKLLLTVLHIRKLHFNLRKNNASPLYSRGIRSKTSGGCLKL